MNVLTQQKRNTVETLLANGISRCPTARTLTRFGSRQKAALPSSFADRRRPKHYRPLEITYREWRNSNPYWIRLSQAVRSE